jgi:hypothetical protein
MSDRSKTDREKKSPRSSEPSTTSSGNGAAKPKPERPPVKLVIGTKVFHKKAPDDL